MSVENPCELCKQYTHMLVEYSMRLMKTGDYRLLEGIESVYGLMFDEAEKQGPNIARVMVEDFCGACNMRSIYDRAGLERDYDNFESFRDFVKEKDPEERADAIRLSAIAALSSTALQNIKEKISSRPDLFDIGEGS